MRGKHLSEIDSVFSDIYNDCNLEKLWTNKRMNQYRIKIFMAIVREESEHLTVLIDKLEKMD